MANCRSTSSSKLVAAGVKRIYGIVGDSLNGITDAIRRQGTIEVDPCPPRGGRRLRGRRRGAPHRRAGGVRRKLRARQPAPDQRPVRLPPLARAGAGRSRRTSHRPRSAPAISRKPIRENLFSRMQPLLRADRRAPTQMPRVLEIAIREAVGKRGVSVVVIPGDVALQGRRDAPPPKPAGLLPATAGGDAGARPMLEQLAGAAQRRRAASTLLCGSGCEGAHERAAGAGRAAQGADGARHARQGARRVGQPFRRRHDRADRLLRRAITRCSTATCC